MNIKQERPATPPGTIASGDRQRECFLVLGMHRSGTSSVAGTLAKLGATPPKNLLGANPGNPNGHWESAPLIAFHDELLQSAGSVWHDWRVFHDGWYETPVAQRFATRAKELLAQEFEQSGTFVFKDPRICRFPRFWLDIFREEGIAPKIVIPLRSPLEVAQSHRSRDSFSIRKDYCFGCATHWMLKPRAANCHGSFSNGTTSSAIGATFWRARNGNSKPSFRH